MQYNFAVCFPLWPVSSHPCGQREECFCRRWKGALEEGSKECIGTSCEATLLSVGSAVNVSECSGGWVLCSKDRGVVEGKAGPGGIWVYRNTSRFNVKSGLMLKVRFKSQ